MTKKTSCNMSPVIRILLSWSVKQPWPKPRPACIIYMSFQGIPFSHIIFNFGEPIEWTMMVRQHKCTDWPWPSLSAYQIGWWTNNSSILLTLNGPSKICSRRHSIFFFFFFSIEKKFWHFIWIVCKADDSREIPTYFLWKWKKKKNLNIIHLQQLWLVL